MCTKVTYISFSILRESALKEYRSTMQKTPKPLQSSNPQTNPYLGLTTKHSNIIDSAWINTQQLLCKILTTVNQVHRGPCNIPPGWIQRITASCTFSSFKPTVSINFNMDSSEWSCCNLNTSSSRQCYSKQKQPWKATIKTLKCSTLQRSQFHCLRILHSKASLFPYRSKGWLRAKENHFLHSTKGK